MAEEARSARERRRQVADLRAEGLSLRQIGIRLGISHELARRDCVATGALTPDDDDSAPAGLQERGRRFWYHVVTNFEPTRHERELLVQTCRLLDHADALEASVAADGVVARTRFGEPKAHPALVELRAVSLALGRLLAQLGVPADEGDAGTFAGVLSPASVRGRRAAQARWGGRGSAS